ncbi:NAD(P)H-dependent oxidoreductase, partial [Escherichia sp. SP-MK2]
MSNILIINGAKKFAHSNGQLNDTLTEVADGTLRDLGHDVRIVRADSDYVVKAEVQNFLWADVVIWQMPGWWMGAPWTVKKYIFCPVPGRRNRIFSTDLCGYDHR